MRNSLFLSSNSGDNRTLGSVKMISLQKIRLIIRINFTIGSRISCQFIQICLNINSQGQFKEIPATFWLNSAYFIVFFRSYDSLNSDQFLKVWQRSKKQTREAILVSHLRSPAIQLSNILKQRTKSTLQFCGEFNTLKEKRLKLEYCFRNLKILNVSFVGGKPKRSQRRKALRLHDCSSANILAGNISRPFYSRLIHSRASFPFKKSVGCVGFFCFRGRRGDREVLFRDLWFV